MAIDPDPDLVERLRERFTSTGDAGVYAHATVWMSATVVRAARQHAQRCGGCQTCRHLSELLSGVAAVQILNPPPVQILHPDRAATVPTVETIVRRELLTAAAARSRMTLTVIVLVALAAATIAALAIQAAGR